MRSATADRYDLPWPDSPLDAFDTLLSAGAVLGILLYVVGLLVANVDVATLGVALGVVCVLATLAFRSARSVVGHLV